MGCDLVKTHFGQIDLEVFQPNTATSEMMGIKGGSSLNPPRPKMTLSDSHTDLDFPYFS
jgi:hypothetical protein